MADRCTYRLSGTDWPVFVSCDPRLHSLVPPAGGGRAVCRVSRLSCAPPPVSRPGHGAPRTRLACLCALCCPGVTPTGLPPRARWSRAQPAADNIDPKRGDTGEARERITLRTLDSGYWTVDRPGAHLPKLPGRGPMGAVLVMGASLEGT